MIDNTEYILVQEELALLDGRIYELDYILRHAEPLLPGEVDGIVRLGSLVVVQQEGAAELESYTLVGPHPAKPYQWR